MQLLKYSDKDQEADRGNQHWLKKQISPHLFKELMDLGWVPKKGKIPTNIENL